MQKYQLHQVDAATQLAITAHQAKPAFGGVPQHRPRTAAIPSATAMYIGPAAIVQAEDLAGYHQYTAYLNHRVGN